MSMLQRSRGHVFHKYRRMREPGGEREAPLITELAK